jgi:hypothetical protein
MLRNLWLAIVTPSLMRRLIFAQLAILLVIWIAMLFLIIRDIAYTDQWYGPRLMTQRGGWLHRHGAGRGISAQRWCHVGNCHTRTRAHLTGVSGGRHAAVRMMDR